MATLLHITADHPDAHSAAKTPAVRRLLDLVPGHRHLIYSINRQNGLSGATIVAQQDDVTTIAYRAPPLGLRLEAGLAPVARLILDDLAARHLTPDLVHAHKFAVEGFPALTLAKRLDLPMLVSFWGNSDQKIIDAKPLLRPRFRDIARRAHVILPATPWAAAYAQATLAIPNVRLSILPIVCALKPPVHAPQSGTRLATLFHLDHFRLKNLPRLIAAVALCNARNQPIGLDVWGGGSEATMSEVQALIEKAGVAHLVALKGPLAHDGVQSTLATYAGFALPSLRETYGMVFIEALFSGLPILYPAGQAVDGFFDDADVGVRCDARSVASIADAMTALVASHAQMKSEIARRHASGYFHRFEAAAIGQTYAAAIAGALAAHNVKNGRRIS